MKRIRKIEQDFFVWISKENQILVSLASFDRIKNNDTNFTAYHEYPIQGILGRLEKKVYDVIFISPFWIWSEGSNIANSKFHFYISEVHLC